MAVTLPGISNPSGLVACYNVAAIQSSSGLFAADLRFYTQGGTTMPSTASIQISLDFGGVATVQNFTSLQSDNVKRHLSQTGDYSSLVVPERPSATTLGLLRIRQLQSQTSNPINPIKAGSLAAVALPQSGLKPIQASAMIGASNTAPAVLPGENRLKVATQAMQTTTRATSSATVSGIPASSTRLAAGTQVETIQFLGRADLSIANANPNGSGMLGSLLPRITLGISGAGAANQTIDMTILTRSFLVGVQGRANVTGQFVFPGRILGGADKSGSLVGVYLVGSYTVVLLTTMIGGVLTRFNMRRDFRNRARRVGKQFVT
ncbi:protein of unknown function [Taphrina deformans PYCC 5710]|uniref:Uncharacterized protein n=1 Tax=Taphrina deformans (strain PYCC 5710 / ATCC 11124 / CBS 356.35 / IMI 108563 / JCM 9778 / NBRC 8474) TaxID=1097556 RepID=R4X8L5_TAPDE|nr:protein of unknown function [Taphrina deformans PYCC 5710]|eukprot:CCG81969.1 protein of unknown function [Taphrina deformans PYCC 5710]